MIVVLGFIEKDDTSWVNRIRGQIQKTTSTRFCSYTHASPFRFNKELWRWNIDCFSRNLNQQSTTSSTILFRNSARDSGRHLVFLRECDKYKALFIGGTFLLTASSAFPVNLARNRGWNRFRAREYRRILKRDIPFTLVFVHLWGNVRRNLFPPCVSSFWVQGFCRVPD